jgi:2-dehydro-3-deoxyphosphogluconate aldolase/(4S)-4-hydroxy-2-oxoglutarate aldolase
MDKKKKVLNLIIEQGILPLYFHSDANVSVQILKTMYRAGIRVIEYTNRGENAWQNFIELRKVADKELPGLFLGAGTIKNKIAATEFVNEGADFIVCPGVIKEVANIVHNNDLLWIPGCMTATEIIYAEDLGATLIKLFPGNLLGTSYVTALKEIFPGLLFMPTGGIETSDENFSAWFKNGVCAVGIGTSLINKEMVDAPDYETLESSARNVLEMVRRVRKS